MIKHRTVHLILAGLLLVAGLLFYIQFRPSHILFEILPWLQALHSPAWQGLMPLSFNHALPSFLHICFMSLMSAAIIGLDKKSAILIPLAWLGIDLLLECLQIGSGRFIQAGVFDVMDVYALLLGCALLLWGFHLKVSAKIRAPNGLLAALLAFGLTTSLGSLVLSCDSSQYQCVTPVVLSLEEFRGEIQPVYGNNASLTRPGKIYAHQQNLYVVDQYRGIHIFDRSDAQNPIRIAYLPIYGALEISIQGSLLYTNSFSDLLVIELSHVLDGSFSLDSYSRTEGVFSLPTSYEFLPENTYINSERRQFSLDLPFRQRPSYDGEGIVIGFINTQGEEILFGEFQ
ncbi:MAG: hypothetical protein RPT11_03620 [Bermanella sp.]